jgi:hypothetical protein
MYKHGNTNLKDRGLTDGGTKIHIITHGDGAGLHVLLHLR